MAATNGLSGELGRDLELARQINLATRADPDSPYAGKFLGIRHQQVVAVGETLDDLEAQLDALGFGPREGVCFEASADYDAIYMVWGLRSCPA